LTDISFHFNVAERGAYAYRLLRKAMGLGARVTVTGEANALAELDRALWSFDPSDFLPHLRLRAGQQVAPRLRTTPVWLVEDVDDAGHHDVLVNLGGALPRGFESFARLIEIVTVDETDRIAARERWKHYAARGYALVRHEVAA
jgi:DNA polymerase-3 subunit chi